MKTAQPGVLLKELLGELPSAALRAEVTADLQRPVQRIVLVDEVDDIPTQGPNALLVLNELTARGGWVISVALRFGWERHAAALVVPQEAVTDAVAELAAKFDIPLLTTNRQSRSLIVDIATAFGTLVENRYSGLETFRKSIREADSIERLNEVVQDQLEADEVQLTFLRPSGIQDGQTETVADGDGVVYPFTMPVLGTAWIVAHDVEVQQDVAHVLLREASLIYKSLLLARYAEAVHSAFPARQGTRSTADTDPSTRRAAVHMLESAGIRERDSFIALQLLSDDPDADAAVVYELWLGASMELRPIRTESGWVCIALTDSSTGAASQVKLLMSLRTMFMRAAATTNLVVGISGTHRGWSDLHVALSEARLAATVARQRVRGSVRESRIVNFQALPQRFGESIVDSNLATALLEAYYPEFMRAPVREQIAHAVTAVYRHGGTIKSASEELGLHRNTLQSRLRQAGELGLPWDQPDRALTLQVLLSAFLRGLRTITEGDKR